MQEEEDKYSATKIFDRIRDKHNAQIFDSVTFASNRKADRNNLSAHMESVADIQGYYGEQSSVWSNMIDQVKLLIENQESSVYLELIKDVTGKKPSENTLGHMVSNDLKVKTLKQVLLLCKKQEALYKNAVSAMSAKGFQLSNMGALDRSERQHIGLHTPSLPGTIEDKKAGIVDRLR